MDITFNTVGQGGWVRVHDPEAGVTGYVRFDLADDGRLYPSELVVQATGGALRGADLRTFPLAAVEASANGELRDKILSRFDRRAEVRFRKADGSTLASPVHPRATVVEDHPPEPRPGPFEVPDTTPYPDEFYVDIAEAYREFARTSQRPAADIADVAGVPVRTVHRWIAEARKRGALAPGRRGKVG